MSSRRKFRAAARWILPAILVAAAGSAPPLLAQSETSVPAVDAAPPSQTGESAAFDAPGQPGVRMMAPRPDTPPAPTVQTMQPAAGTVLESTIVPGVQMVIPAMPSVTSAAQEAAGAVFDAPNQPGVRMMAPIPDSQPVVVSPTLATPVAGPRPVTAASSGARRSLVDQAVAAAKDGKWSQAQRLAGESGSRPAALLVEWLYLTDRGSDASFVQLSAFMNAHPNWPRRDALISRAEEAMPIDIDPKLVIEWYGDREPLTATGLIRLGEAMLVSGTPDRGMQLIRKAWCEESFSAQEEAAILQAHGDILRDADHRARLDQRLALDDITGARRQIARVDGESRRVGEARLRLKSSPEAVASVMASLPAELHGNRGLLHDASRAYRRRDRDEEAYQTLLKTPAELGVATLPDSWWSERQVLARDALKDKRHQLAYDIVSKHGLASGAGFADAEFLSGWIALRFLSKPDAALKHFQTLANGVSLPISVARAYYWSGRAEEALQHPNEAIAHYRRAAQNAETFYGQLALARIEDSPMLRLTSATQVPTRADEAAFEADERVGVIRVLSEARDRNLARTFALRIANDTPDAKRLHLLAQLMISLGDPAMGVRVAKVASYNGVMLLSHLAPVVTLPRFPGTAAGPDPALVLGVTRQESEFDPAVVSSAGARGLMQLMPATAQRAASMNRLGFRLGDLTSNPRYNMQLGMVTLDDYLAYWGDSYVLAIASYNAGPTNVRRWVEANGDPRDSSVDPIDWIEMIPFSETRNYVQRVLENIEVYRNRLSGTDQRLTILSDLYRPKLPNRVVLKEQAPPPSEVPIPVRRPGTTALQ